MLPGAVAGLVIEGIEESLDAEEDRQVSAFAAGFLSHWDGVEAWTDISVALPDDGPLRLAAREWFSDVSRIRRARQPHGR